VNILKYFVPLALALLSGCGAMDIQPEQLVSVTRVANSSLARFDDYNRRPLDTAPAGASGFDGGVVAQVGNRERFIDGGLNVVLNGVQGNGLGSIGAISMNGPNTQNGLLDIGSTLNITVTQISGTVISGKITGEFSDRFAFDPQFSEEFQVEANFNGHFIDTGGITGIVGVFSGTIIGETDGEDTLNGVLVAKQDLFF